MKKFIRNCVAGLTGILFISCVVMMYMIGDHILHISK